MLSSRPDDVTTGPARDAGACALESRRLAVLALVACALALPLLLWDFRTYQLAFAATNAIAILGLNLIAGQAGLISLGHGAFMGWALYPRGADAALRCVRVRGDPRGGTGRPRHRGVGVAIASGVGHADAALTSTGCRASLIDGWPASILR